MKLAPFLLLPLLLAAPRLCAARQDAPPSAPAPPRASLDALRFDPATQGALFYVAPLSVYDHENPASSNLTPTQFAEVMGSRWLRKAHVSALVPQTMITVAPVPKNADPFAGMQASERFQLLMGTLSPAQWSLAGSSTGIGLSDMTPEQRPLFAGMFPPEDFILQTYRISPERGTDDEAMWQPQGESQKIPVRGTRLRLRRQTTLSFSSPAGGDGYFSTVNTDDDENFVPGATKLSLENGYTLSGDPSTDWVEDEQTAYGVQVTYPEPNRAKPSDLNLSAPAFNVSIVLDGSHKTVGDLMAACAKKTRLTLVADKRMAVLPVAWRVAPGGNAATVGEVLTLLSRSVTGTFRKLTPADGSQPVYLLTDDREGLGTRLTRLFYWSEQMRGIKDALIQKANRAAAKSDPLGKVRFAPDDPFALPAALSDAADTTYRNPKSSEGAAAQTADLPPALREYVARVVESRREYDKGISSDRLRVGVSMVCEYVFPGGKSVVAPFGRSLPQNYLRDTATTMPRPRPEPLKPPGETLVPILPRTASRRVCIAPLPATEADTKTMLQLLRAKGFTETWFAVSLRDPDAPARLVAAATLAKSLKITVGAAASLLKRGAGEEWGTDDINVAGETGAELAVRFVTLFREQIENGNESVPSPEEAEYVFDFLQRNMSGWTTPDAKAAQSPLSRLLAVPGMSAVALSDTAAPGWDYDGRGGTPPGFSLGHTLQTRIACVRGAGIDPIDVTENNGILGAVPLMRDDLVNGAQTVATFRLAEAGRELSVLTKTVPATAPLYLEKPGSFITSNGREYTRFAPGNAKTGVKPPETLVTYSPTFDYETNKVIAEMLKMANAASKTGFVVNFAQTRPADTLRYLKALRDAPPETALPANKK